jgi:hypothetical protein
MFIVVVDLNKPATSSVATLDGLLVLSYFLMEIAGSA